MRKSTSNKTLLIGGVAALVLLGGGGLYMALQRPEAAPPAAPEKAAPAGEAAPAEGEAGHAEDGQAAEGEVELTVEQQQAAGIAVVSVARGGGGETRLSGRVEAMVDARAAVGAVVGGTVERVLVAPGQTVRAGQALVSLVSGEGAALRAEIDAASAAAAVARQAHQRNQNLADQGVVARQEVETSQAQELSAEAAARAARARATAAGSPNASGRMSVVSPISGVVTNVQVGPGGFVAQGGVVAEVTNPARVELVFNAPPQLAAQVRPGSHVRVTGPQGEFDALVTGVAADAGLQDSGATVIRARVESGRLPPAGSPVTGAVVTEGQSGGALTVPSEAVQTVDGATVVFIKTDHGFRAQPVLAGRRAGGSTEILRGLTGTERVASTNAFLLKAELAKGEAEHGH
ncbi:Cation efflux system protein CzcB [Brevundimonas diminuta]|jgi:cobalt-zinc-cadmium efflux system membrane fusion protein|uniref:Cation efflux system protein CzcB n=2 Tax=Brevundimonas diminuta TaxID=293 RepID=A0A246KMT0_BREDI|nr:MULTISPECIES: efflux RND transporter periplasmic adaptor subunit [Brevundimonas]EKY24350.1 efflux transporter, RND family, MFP subunit [Brevundimonas diminuta 470-4]MBD3574526.1 efflux RND transporter periplasmic adaptor subunit [Brevundimonas diminuta]MBD3817493.1 efflux RND transporter periplasmic adaptor subunit [Brevundimonas diminuta]MDM8351473.1 efflux RND transporter periplasmic adaptor subunit [Brevundimonas diminuta]OMG60737.1 efflux transporter periplasmic adaptor subunit [Brevund